MSEKVKPWLSDAKVYDWPLLPPAELLVIWTDNRNSMLGYRAAEEIMKRITRAELLLLEREKPSNWRYESDGEIGARTHYAVRDNDAFPLGVERRDFHTAAEAREFITAQPSVCPHNKDWDDCPDCRH